jgi:hypothetical protein
MRKQVQSYFHLPYRQDPAASALYVLGERHVLYTFSTNSAIDGTPTQTPLRIKVPGKLLTIGSVLTVRFTNVSKPGTTDPFTLQLIGPNMSVNSILSFAAATTVSNVSGIIEYQIVGHDNSSINLQTIWGIVETNLQTLATSGTGVSINVPYLSGDMELAWTKTGTTDAPSIQGYHVSLLSQGLITPAGGSVKLTV